MCRDWLQEQIQQFAENDPQVYRDKIHMLRGSLSLDILFSELFKESRRGGANNLVDSCNLVKFI